VEGTGDQFLSRAGFAYEEHCAVGGCHELDLCKDITERRTLADDGVEEMGFSHLLAQITHLAAKCATFSQ
jgi:hypothetical protein